MELTLNRTIKLNDRTIGELFVNGKKFCDTIEDTERFTWINKRLFGTKIFGKTAIPTGRYEVDTQREQAISDYMTTINE